MKNKFWIGGILVVVVLLAIFALKNGGEKAPDTTLDATEQTSSKTATPKSTNTSKTPSSLVQTNSTPTGLPEIEFIDKILSFSLKNYDKVNVRIQKVAFGRGDATESTGCQGIPNTNFSAYLYPGSSVCLGNDLVDGSKRGILAIHLLIENNGNYNFGGNAGTMRLHYLRSNAEGVPVHRFAYPLTSLASYNIGSYSSREIILSYLVPEDQQFFNFLIDHSGELPSDISKNVYQNATQGVSINFKTKIISIVK